MSYQVEWNEDAEAHLAQIWLDVEDRTSVTAAAAALNIQLQRDAAACRESRMGTTRIVFVAPLAVLFEVFVPEQRTVVTSVWRYG
jgi:cell division protein ZapA (FtsZ GTPase activity inhibitor)